MIMKKLFISTDDIEDLANNLIDCEFYYLWSHFGDLIGYGTWERDNECFYDNDNDVTYSLSDADFIMRKPTVEQLSSM